jgi:hypothetical protein
MAQGIDVLQLLTSSRHPPRGSMLTWLRMMIHSLTILSILTWLVMNGLGAVLETRGAIICLLQVGGIYVDKSACEEKYTSTKCMMEMITSTKVH